MSHKEKDGHPYYWSRSKIFDDTWVVWRRFPLKIIANGSKFEAKRLTKELNAAAHSPQVALPQ